MVDEEEEEISSSEIELEANESLKGQIKFQAWEQARDKTINDYYISKRNMVNIKLALVLRRLKEKRIDEITRVEDGKNREATFEEEVMVAKELQNNEILALISSTVHQRGEITSLYEERKNKGVLMAHQDAMSETYYHDIARLERSDALLTALLDEDDLPSVPMEDIGDMVRRKIRMKIGEKLFGEQNDGRPQASREDRRNK